MIANCINCKAPMCISHISLFRNLSISQQALIVSHVNRRIYRKGEIFIHEGELLQSFVIVSQGRFKTTTTSMDGKSSTLSFLNKGDFFGQQALFQEMEIPYTVEASEDGVLCMIDSVTMKDLMSKNVELSMAIVSALSERVSSLEYELSSASSEKIEDRLLRLLYDLSKDYGKQQASSIHLRLPMNQEEIAKRLRVSRESVNRNLKKMHEEKVIKILSRKEIILPKM